MDIQEVVFTQQVIGLSEFDYSLLISITGIGSVVDAILLTVFLSKFSLRYMITIGLIMMTIGYVNYAFSWSFSSIIFSISVLKPNKKKFYQEDDNAKEELNAKIKQIN